MRIRLRVGPAILGRRLRCQRPIGRTPRTRKVFFAEHPPKASVVRTVRSGPVAERPQLVLRASQPDTDGVNSLESDGTEIVGEKAMLRCAPTNPVIEP